MSAPGRPKGEYRKAQPEGSPMSASSSLLMQPDEATLRVSGTYIGVQAGSTAGTGGAPRWRKAELACVPMTQAHEYASVVQFEQPQTAPVRVTPSQRYEILTVTVRELRQCVPGLEFIGVRLYGSDFDVQLSRSEEHTSELQSPTTISYAVFCL